MRNEEAAARPWTTWGSCRERCPEVQRGCEEANRLRILLAQAVDRLPPDDPLADDMREALQ